MAAKQGLSAQISQASEDAKRAVLNRTSLTTSLWFSNLNTTCTIKSAPPRTPEVLSLLSTKSGWLFKRNEQHVWQTRWCCVVPHTFLYYFDANVLPGEAQPPVPSTALQEDWNQAVANGYPHRGNRKQQAPRSSLYFLPGGGASNHNHHDGGGGGGGGSGEQHPPHHGLGGAESPTHAVIPPPGAPPASSESFASMQPAGIIDLECYTSVHRSQQNQLVLELAGDDAVNPDLRQFYFSAGSENETEAWTQALLGQRHTALMDETDAYKQVCDGFAQQLQVLHTELDSAQKHADDASEELYQVRSEMEDGRRSCWKLVEQVLDRQHSQVVGPDGVTITNPDAASSTNIATSQSFRNELDAIRSQDISLLAPVQLLSDYTRVLEDSCNELQEQNKQLQTKLSETKNSDHDQCQKLQEELEETKAELERVQSRYTQDTTVLQQSLQERTKELEDMGKELASTRMETTMYQSSTRNKLTELQNHKKILKKEVIDLRQKLEDAVSELSLVTHKEKSHRLEVDQERKKAELLERYVDKMESQVKVQQNMMEMMSASGVGSVYGGGSQQQHYEVAVPSRTSVHSPPVQQGSPSRRNTLEGVIDTIHAGDTAGLAMPKDDDDEEEEDNGVSAGGGRGLVHPLPSQNSRRYLDDCDNKSHMSELTEDRTQRQFDALQYLRETRDLRDREFEGGRQGTPNARLIRYSSAPGATPSPRTTPPPAYIIGAGGGSIQQQHQQQLLHNFQNPDSAKLDTIHHSGASIATTPNRVLPPEHNLPRAVRSSSQQQQQPLHHVTIDGHGSSRSLGAGMTPQRLSVAQRARLQAERGSTPVKVRLESPDTLQSSPQLPHHERGAERRHSTSSRTSQGGGFFSNIGRKLEAAIDKSVFSVEVPGDGRPSDEDDTGDDDDLSSDDNSSVETPNSPPRRERPSSSEQYGGDYDRDEQQMTTPVRKPAALLTRETLDGPGRAMYPTSPTHSNHSKSSRNRSNHGKSSRKHSLGSLGHASSLGRAMASVSLSPRRASGGYEEEKKTPTPDRSVNSTTLSLKERQQLQKAKQIQFLKDQGLIKDETEAKGAASPSYDAGSVTSTHVSSSGPAESTVSFPGTSPQRR